MLRKEGVLSWRVGQREPNQSPTTKKCKCSLSCQLMLILRPLSKRVPISTSTTLPSLSFSPLAAMKLALAALSAAALASTVHAEQDDFVPTHLKAPLLEQFTDSCVPPSHCSTGSASCHLADCLNVAHWTRLADPPLCVWRLSTMQLGGAMVALARYQEVACRFGRDLFLRCVPSCNSPSGRPLPAHSARRLQFACDVGQSGATDDLHHSVHATDFFP